MAASVDNLIRGTATCDSGLQDIESHLGDTDDTHPVSEGLLTDRTGLSVYRTLASADRHGINTSGLGLSTYGLLVWRGLVGIVAAVVYPTNSRLSCTNYIQPKSYHYCYVVTHVSIL